MPSRVLFVSIFLVRFRYFLLTVLQLFISVLVVSGGYLTTSTSVNNCYLLVVQSKSISFLH